MRRATNRRGSAQPTGSQKSAWGKRGCTERCSHSYVLEPRFWIASGLPTMPPQKNVARTPFEEQNYWLKCLLLGGIILASFIPLIA
jgi:hypothetical protein